MSYATTDQLETALRETVNGGDALADIVGCLIAVSLDDQITAEDIQIAREAILTWHRGTSHIRSLA